MNKKYIDFVPAKSKSGGTGASARVRRVGTPQVSVEEVYVDAPRVGRVSAVRATSRVNAKSGTRTSVKTKEKVSVKPKATVSQEKSRKKTKSTYSVPNMPFINQNKVAKRPLSKNVYQKKIEATKEGSIKPVAIVSKPEKDSKAGLIIGIIITIILGAAAGTVAFLLLPK